MSWLNRQKPIDGESTHDTRVEVVVQKSAAKEVVEEAKEVNEKLNRLLVDNGFTLRIYLATGGKLPGRKLKGKG